LLHFCNTLTLKDIETEEIFTDLVAISALKKIVPPHGRLFNETIELRSYTGREQGTKYFGRDMQEKVMKNPESHLKKLLNLTKINR
jgi:hypothetical protein